MGDSRYVVEPNVKDGKGGLRDLHTLYWIGKYVHGVEQPADLVRVGLFTAAEFRKFERAERFFWAVRCHLHLAAGRAEERLGFDNQRHIAEVMRYADRPGKSAVERFMQFYFLNAKNVGDLTGIFLAQLDEQLAKKGFRFTLPTLRRKPKRLSGFVLDRGRLSIPSDDYFAQDPVRLIEIFAFAAREKLEIHPAAMRAASRDAKLIDEKVRNDPRANALFLDVLDVHQFARAGAALDERGGRVRPLRSRLRPRRRADAVRHVPPLYGRRAYRPGDRAARGDRARRAEGRPSAGHRLVQAARIAADALCRGAPARHRQGPGRRSQRPRRRYRDEAWAAFRPRCRRDGDGFLARALPPPHVGDRVQARPCRPEDRRGFHPAGAEPGAPAAAADPDGGGYPRGRPGHLERVEARSPDHLVRRRGGAPSPRSQAARPHRAGRGAQAAADRRAGLEEERGAGLCEAPARQLLAGRAAREPARECAAGRFGRSADPRRLRAARLGGGRSRQRGDASVGLRARPRGPLLSRLRRPCRGGGQHHRRAHPHHARRHGARQSARAGRAGPRLCRSPPEEPARSGRRNGSVIQRSANPAAGAEPGTKRRLPGRAVRDRRRAGLDPHHGGRGECPRPARLARTACRRDPRLRVHRPFRAYRDLWRARGRRLLPDQAGRREIGRRGHRSASGRLAARRRAKPRKPRPHRERARRFRRALPVQLRSP